MIKIVYWFKKQLMASHYSCRRYCNLRPTLCMLLLLGLPQNPITTANCWFSQLHELLLKIATHCWTKALPKSPNFPVLVQSIFIHCEPLPSIRSVHLAAKCSTFAKRSLYSNTCLLQQPLVRLQLVL